MRLVDLMQVAKDKFQETTNDNLQASSGQPMQFNSIERKSLLLANPTIWLCENCKDTNLESLDIASRNPMQQYEAILDETASITIAIQQATHEDDIDMKSLETKGISAFLDELKTMTTENYDNSISSAAVKELNVVQTIVSTSDMTSIIIDKQDVLLVSEPVFAGVKSQELLLAGVSTENEVIITSRTASDESTATISTVETSGKEERFHRPSSESLHEFPRYHNSAGSQLDDKHEINVNTNNHNLYKRLQLSHLPVHQNPTTTTVTTTTILAPPSAQTFHQHTSAQAPVKTPLQVSTPTQWAVEFLRENEAAAAAVASSLVALLLVYVFHTVSDHYTAYRLRRQQQRQKERQKQREKQAEESEHVESAEWEEADSTDHNQPQLSPAQQPAVQQSKRSGSTNVTVPDVSMNFSKEYSAQEEERIPEGGNIYPHMLQRTNVGVTKAVKHIGTHVPFADGKRGSGTHAAAIEGDSENAHLTESDLRQDEAQNHAILHNTLAVSTDFDGIMARSHDHNNARSLHMHQLRQLSLQNINTSAVVKTQLAVQEAVLLCDDITSSVSDPMYYFDAPEVDNESANMVAMLESVRMDSRDSNKTTTSNVTPFAIKNNAVKSADDETQTHETPASAVLDMSVIYTHHNNNSNNSNNSKRSNESTPRFSEVNPLFSPAVLTSAAHNAPSTPIATTMSTRKVTTTSVSDYSGEKKSVAAVWAEQEDLERRLSQQNNQMYYGEQLVDGDDAGSGAVSDNVKGGIRGILSGNSNSNTTGSSVIHSADYYHNLSHDVPGTNHNINTTNIAIYSSAAITTLSHSSSDSNHDNNNDIMYTYSTDTNTYTIDTHTIDTHTIDTHTMDSVYDTFSTFNTETTVFVDLNDLPLEQHHQNNFDHNPDHTDSESLLTAVSQLPVTAPRKSRSNEKLEPFAHLLSESCSIFDELRYFEEHCLVEEQGEHDVGDFSIGGNGNNHTANGASVGKTVLQTMNNGSDSNRNNINSSSTNANTAVSATTHASEPQHSPQHNTVRMLQMVYTLNSLSSSGESEPKSVLDYAVLLDKHNCGESVEQTANSNSKNNNHSGQYIPPYQQYNSHSHSNNSSPVKHTLVHHTNIGSTDNAHPQQQSQPHQQHGRKRSVSDNSRFNTSNTPKRAVPAGAIVATSPPEDTDVAEIAADGMTELDVTVVEAVVDSAAASVQTTTIPHVINTGDSIGDIHSSSRSDSSDLLSSTIFHKIMTTTPTTSADDGRASNGTSISDLFHAQFNSEFVQLGSIHSADTINGDIGDNDNHISNLLSGISSTYSSPERVRFEQLYTIREGSCDSGDHSPNHSLDRTPEPSTPVYTNTTGNCEDVAIVSDTVVAEVVVKVDISFPAIRAPTSDDITMTENVDVVTPSLPDSTLPVLPSNAFDMSYMRDILSTNDQLQQTLHVLSSPVRRARAGDAVETDVDSTMLMHTPAKTVDSGAADGIFTPTPTATPTASLSAVAAVAIVEQNNTSNSSINSSGFHDSSLAGTLSTEPTSPAAVAAAAAVSHHSNRRKKQGVVLRSPPDTVDKRLLARARETAADRGLESLDPIENIMSSVSIGSVHSTGSVNLSGLLHTPPPKSRSGSGNNSINSGSSVVDRILEIAAVHSPQHRSVNRQDNGSSIPPLKVTVSDNIQVFTSPPIKSSGVYNWEAQQQAIEAQRGSYFRPHPLSSLALGGTDDVDDISVLTCEFDNIAPSTPDAQPSTPLETTATTATNTFTQQQTPTQTEELQLQQLKELHGKCSQFIFQLAQFQRRETDAQFEREQQLEMLNESGNDLLYAVNYSSPSAEGNNSNANIRRNGSSGTCSSGGDNDSLLQAEILFSSLLLDHLSEKREETETLVSQLLDAIHTLNNTNSNNSVHNNNINNDNNASPATVLSTASSVTNNRFDLLALSIATPAATAPSPHPSTLVQMDAEYVDARVEELRQSLEGLLSTHINSSIGNNNSNNIEKSDTTPRTKQYHNNNDTAGYHTAAEDEEQEEIGSDEDGDDSVASSVEPYVFTLESTQNNLNRNLNLELLAAEHQHAHNGKNNNDVNSAISSGSGSHSFSFTLPPSSTRKTTLEVSSDYYNNNSSLHSPQRQYNTSGTVSGGSNSSTPNKQNSSSGNNGISSSNSNIIDNSNSKSKQLHRPKSLHNLISSSSAATSPIKNTYNNDIHPMHLRSPDSNKSSKSSNSAAVQTSSPTRGQGGRNPVNSFDVRLVSPRSANQQQQYQQHQQLGHIGSPHSAHSPKSESSAYTTPQSSPQVRSSVSDTRSQAHLSKLNGKTPSIHDIGYVLSTRQSYDHDLYSQLVTSSTGVLSVHSSPTKLSNSNNNSNNDEPITPPANRSSGIFVSSSITAHKSPPSQSYNSNGNSSNGIVVNNGGNSNVTTLVNKTSNMSGTASSGSYSSHSSYSRSRSAARRQNKARSSGTPSSGLSVPLVQLTPESFTTPTKQSYKPLDTPTEF